MRNVSHLLKDGTVREQVEQSAGRVSTTQRMEDFCDGHVFSEHPLFSSDRCALQIIGYYDEVELCNPLGAYVKRHKLGLVFFALANIHPKFRSALWAMNLVSVASAPMIEKHGIDAILAPFIRDLKILATEGVTVHVEGTDYHYRGALLAFLADTLASHQLGGFKLSMAWAFRMCRTCLATNVTAKVNFNSKAFKLRTLEKHKHQCDLLEGPLGDHYSTTYGINRRSSLLNIPHFDMCSWGLPHDIMHDLLEGVVQYELKLLLSHCCAEEYLTLEEFNRRLLRFDYGYSEIGDKPLPILSRNLQSSDKHLRLNASQLCLLSRVFPLLIGDCVPANLPQWQCYLVLLKIVDIALCPIASESMCGILKTLIEEHHTLFLTAFPGNSVLPKMHYMLHYPEQIMALGPLVRAWTMRYEAKLSFFKKAGRIGNFKNIELSLARRHQRLMCYELASGRLLQRPVECGPCSLPNRLGEEAQSIQDGIHLLFPFVSFDATICRPSWVKYNGIVYKKNNSYLIIGVDGLYPKFGCVNDILVLGVDVIVFVLTPCEVVFYDNHMHAYAITLSSGQMLMPYGDLSDYSVLHGYKSFLSDSLRI